MAETPPPLRQNECAHVADDPLGIPAGVGRGAIVEELSFPAVLFGDFDDRLDTDDAAGFAPFVQNLDLNARFDLSKGFYALLNALYPLDMMFANYKKEKANRVEFHVEFHDGVVKINDKVLR